MGFTTRAFRSSVAVEGSTGALIGSVNGKGIIKRIYVDTRDDSDYYGQWRLIIDGQVVIDWEAPIDSITRRITNVDISNATGYESYTHFAGIDYVAKEHISYDYQHVIWNCNLPFNSSFEIWGRDSDTDAGAQIVIVQAIYMLEV